MVQWYNSTVLQCYSSTVVQQYRFLLPEWDVEMENVTMFHLATEGSTKKRLSGKESGKESGPCKE